MERVTNQLGIGDSSRRLLPYFRQKQSVPDGSARNPSGFLAILGQILLIREPPLAPLMVP